MSNYPAGARDDPRAPYNLPQLSDAESQAIEARAAELAGDGFDCLDPRATNWLAESADPAALCVIVRFAIRDDVQPHRWSYALSCQIDKLRTRYVQECAQLYRTQAEADLTEEN